MIVWSDSRCTGSPVSIGDMMILNPRLGTTVVPRVVAGVEGVLDNERSRAQHRSKDGKPWSKQYVKMRARERMATLRAKRKAGKERER